MALPGAGLVPVPKRPPAELSAAPVAPGGGAARMFSDGAAPEAAVGIALREATGLAPDEETEIPAPGESWLDALSRLAALLAALRPVSISLSSAVTCLELP